MHSKKAKGKDNADSLTFNYKQRPTHYGGKLQQQGRAVRAVLEGAARAREMHKIALANAEAAGAMSVLEGAARTPEVGFNSAGPSVSCAEKLSKNLDRYAARSAKTAADALFVGDATRIQMNISKLQSRPDYREAVLAMAAATKDKTTAPGKRQQAMECVVAAVGLFLEKVMCATGSRSTEDQNAVDAVLCAIVDTSMFDKRLGREVGRMLKLQWKALHRGALLREKIDISPGWVRMCKAAYRSQLGHVSVVLINDWLHSDDASRVDNSHKEPVTVIVSSSIDGCILYDKHPRRVFAGPWPVLLERFKKSSAWEQVQRLWPKVNFTKKRKGSPETPKAPISPNIRLLRKYKCVCTYAPDTPDMTSCKVCSAMRVNLKIYSKQRALLCYNTGEVSLQKAPPGTKGWCSPRPVNPCSACNGMCHSRTVHFLAPLMRR